MCVVYTCDMKVWGVVYVLSEVLIRVVLIQVVYICVWYIHMRWRVWSLVCVFCRVYGYLYVVCMYNIWCVVSLCVWCPHVIRRCEAWYMGYLGYRGVWCVLLIQVVYMCVVCIMCSLCQCVNFMCGMSLRECVCVCVWERERERACVWEACAQAGRRALVQTGPASSLMWARASRQLACVPAPSRRAKAQRRKKESC